MKRRRLLRHLQEHGCQVLTEGKGHTKMINPATGQQSPVPRHVEVKQPLARAICRQLGVPAPAGS